MNTITVIFHDDPASPIAGLREAVKAVADKNGAQLEVIDPNKVTISGGTSAAAWMDLQPIFPIQISHDGSAAEHTALLKAMQEAAGKPKPKKAA
jgi:hypothetical protein